MTTPNAHSAPLRCVYNTYIYIKHITHIKTHIAGGHIPPTYLPIVLEYVISLSKGLEESSINLLVIQIILMTTPNAHSAPLRCVHIYAHNKYMYHTQRQIM